MRTISALIGGIFGADGRELWKAVKRTAAQRTIKWLSVLLAAFSALAILGELAGGWLEYKNYISTETSAMIRLSKDGSLGELLGYCLQELSVLFPGFLALRTASMAHLALTWIIQWMCLDDMLQIHESAGAFLGPQLFRDVGELRSSDLGEMTYMAFVFVMILAAFLAGLANSGKSQKLLALLFLPALGLIGFSAVGLDMLHALVPESQRIVAGLVAALEDGTEMIGYALFLLCALVQVIMFENDETTGGYWPVWGAQSLAR